MARPKGFTLIELLVVSAISILLMTVGVTVYLTCLKIYRDGQGVTNVYETAKLINHDLHSLLSNVVPVPGNWIRTTPLPVRCFPGGADIPPNTKTNEGIDYWYSAWYGDAKWQYYSNAATPIGYSSDPLSRDFRFSGAQDGAYYGTYATNGHLRYGDPGNWWNTNNQNGNDQNIGGRGWWMPAFFGKRDGTDANTLKLYDFRVGSWGWPRADYRLDADADDLAAHNNVACWFYAEDKNFNSAKTLALDNANIVLASVKFSLFANADGNENTQLSFLKHHITGFDHPTLCGGSLVRADAAYGNMMRAIEVKPMHLNSGALTAMDNAALGADLNGIPTSAAGGDKLPRAFDVKYTLRNQSNNQRYKFAFRAYCYTNPQ